jgi:hypothetical protein
MLSSGKTGRGVQNRNPSLVWSTTHIATKPPSKQRTSRSDQEEDGTRTRSRCCNRSCSDERLNENDSA